MPTPALTALKHSRLQPESQSESPLDLLPDELFDQVERLALEDDPCALVPDWCVVYPRRCNSDDFWKQFIPRQEVAKWPKPSEVTWRQFFFDWCRWQRRKNERLRQEIHRELKGSRPRKVVVSYRPFWLPPRFANGLPKWRREPAIAL